jgi:hypothetical protein
MFSDPGDERFALVVLAQVAALAGCFAISALSSRNGRNYSDSQRARRFSRRRPDDAAQLRRRRQARVSSVSAARMAADYIEVYRRLGRGAGPTDSDEAAAA